LKAKDFFIEIGWPKTTPRFHKGLWLPALANDLAAFFKSLVDEPEKGKPLGNNFYKIRLAIASKNKGKSGGARIIAYVKITATTVFLNTIYDKSEKSTITDKELELIFKLIL
jgi:hypothetical protein